MNGQLDGFWQVLFPDQDEDVRAVGTGTLAIREAGCWIYAGDRYMEFHADKERVVPAAYPPTDREAAAMFRTHRAVYGTWSGEADGERIVVTHRPEFAVDPRMERPPYQHALRIDGDVAEVGGVTGDVVRWRRLSGRGSSPLSGAWETGDDEDRWSYLVTAGHYGVMRADLAVLADAPRDAEPTEADAAAFFAARSLNAGAHLVATRTADHWPMYGSTTAYEMRKHPTFYFQDIQADEFLMAFGRDEEPTRWWRVA